MIKTSAFQQIIESVESLSLEDQEILLDILQKRFHQQRRTNLSQEIREIRQEFAEGNVQFGSVDQFLTQLDQHSYRILFEFVENSEEKEDAILLSNLGSHDEVY